MALISCPECGREISDRANSCPHCGCPLAEKNEVATFCLQREAKIFFCAIKYDVYLDGQLWGKLKNGESLSATLSCGIHHLKLIDVVNFKTVVYDSDFFIGEEGLIFSFSARMKVTMSQSVYSSGQEKRGSQCAQTLTSATAPKQWDKTPGGRTCSRCGNPMSIQTVSEEQKAGCATILIYILLAISILGIFIIIPLMLRKRNKTVTYAVCQRCGYKHRL